MSRLCHEPRRGGSGRRLVALAVTTVRVGARAVLDVGVARIVVPARRRLHGLAEAAVAAVAVALGPGRPRDQAARGGDFRLGDLFPGDHCRDGVGQLVGRRLGTREAQAEPVVDAALVADLARRLDDDRFRRSRGAE